MVVEIPKCCVGCFKLQTTPSVICQCGGKLEINIQAIVDIANFNTKYSKTVAEKTFLFNTKIENA